MISHNCNIFCNFCYLSIPRAPHFPSSSPPSIYRSLETPMLQIHSLYVSVPIISHILCLITGSTSGRACFFFFFPLLKTGCMLLIATDPYHIVKINLCSLHTWTQLLCVSYFVSQLGIQFRLISGFQQIITIWMLQEFFPVC